jgi:hypothetical protein
MSGAAIGPSPELPGMAFLPERPDPGSSGYLNGACGVSWQTRTREHGTLVRRRAWPDISQRTANSLTVHGWEEWDVSDDLIHVP